MYIRDYIQATYETVEKNGDVHAVLQNLETYLKRRGLTKLYPQILRGLLEKIRRSEKSSIPKVILARENDVEKYETDITTALKELGVTSNHEIQIDESIIGGFIVKGKNERIDTSYKNTLLHAYQRLVD